MRGASFFLTIMLVSSVAAFAGGDEMLDWGSSNGPTAASIGQQPALYAEIAERQLRAADQLYNNGQVDAARARGERVW